MFRFFLIFSVFISYLSANTSILIVNSYHKGYTKSDVIIEAIENILSKDKNTDISVLYMDSKRIVSPEYFDKLKELYSVQMKNRQYDLVITLDDFAYKFIIKNYKYFFTSEKILALGLFSYKKEELKKLKLQNKVSVYLIKKNMSENVQIIKTLIPRLKTLYIIDSTLGNKNNKLFLKNTIQNIKYLSINNTKELAKILSKKEKNAAVFFIKLSKNKKNEVNNNKITKILKNSLLPVFINNSLFIRKGALGGKVLSLELFGKNSGRLALDIIKKEQSVVKLSRDSKIIFNYQELLRFDLFPILSIKDYTLINKNENFFDKYRALINYVFILSPLLMILIFALVLNIYRRFELEKKLKARIHFDNVMLNAIESPIFWQDENERIIDANIKFCTLIDIKLKKLQHKKLKDFKKNKKVNIVMDFLEENKKQRGKDFIFRYSDKDLDDKIYLIKQKKYFDKKTGSSGVVSIFTDITAERAIAIERKRNQQFILQQSKLAELGEIFSSIAHQWKAPLVEITTIAQELFYSSPTSSKNDTNERESYVGEIFKQVKYMNDTMNEFQEFIKPSYSKHIFSVKEAIGSMLEIMNHNIVFNYINITIEVDKNTNDEVLGFKNEFMQSFLNIINNARDVLLKNDFKKRNININIYNEKDYVVIKVQDNAGGIKDKDIKKIFEPYFSTKVTGHGLGLYMAKVIIEDKMAGSIKVENINDGACFTIKIGQII
ncbi:MAG: hypothetical protein HRT41_06040 [Campylobacteraceae bacterium]|nr:hypothetical protein [Campylobacteraceae bacterium]